MKLRLSSLCSVFGVRDLHNTVEVNVLQTFSNLGSLRPTVFLWVSDLHNTTDVMLFKPFQTYVHWACSVSEVVTCTILLKLRFTNFFKLRFTAVSNISGVSDLSAQY